VNKDSKGDSVHTELFLLPTPQTLLLLQGPSALSSGIFQVFPEKFCITVQLLGDQS